MEFILFFALICNHSLGLPPVQFPAVFQRIALCVFRPTVLAGCARFLSTSLALYSILARSSFILFLAVLAPQRVIFFVAGFAINLWVFHQFGFKPRRIVPTHNFFRGRQSVHMSSFLSDNCPCFFSCYY